jgi:hypothetical protein
MASKDLWEELNIIPDPLIEYSNDTELSVEVLQQLDWTLSGTEKSGYSSTWADTYTEPTGKFAMKVFNDGYVEFYEIA